MIDNQSRIKEKASSFDFDEANLLKTKFKMDVEIKYVDKQQRRQTTDKKAEIIKEVESEESN